MLNEQSDLLEHLETIVGTGRNGSRQTLQIEHVSPMGRGYRVKFIGYDDRDAAETLRETLLSVAREVLPALGSDEAYLVDLLGACVFGPDGQALGEVIELQSYPSVDALVIRTLDGKTVELPWVDDWVESFDTSANRIKLSSLEGLL